VQFILVQNKDAHVCCELEFRELGDFFLWSRMVTLPNKPVFKSALKSQPPEVEVEGCISYVLCGHSGDLLRGIGSCRGTEK
jgi:hypothetical protein